MGQLVAAAQGAQHVAGFQAGGRAGRAAGDGQALDAHDQRLAFDVVEAHVQVVRHALRLVAIDEHLLHVFQTGQHAVVQRLYADVFNGHFFLGDAVGLAHADDLVRGQGARTHTALVATAVHLRFQADAGFAAHKQRANAFGAVGFVRGQAHQIDGHFRQVELDAAGGLGSVGVEDHTLFAADGSDGGDVLDHADFVVHEHHAGQDGVGADGRLEGLQIDQAVSLHVQVSHFKTLALQLAAGVEHGLVLGFDRDDVFALGLVEMRGTLERQVVGFGGTRSPDDFTRVGTDQCGHLFAGFFYRGFRLPAPCMAARRGVAEVLAQPGNHGIHHPLVAGVGGAVVHVDGEVWGVHWLALENFG